MKLLVTGGGGQLARAMAGLRKDDVEIIPRTRAELDIADAASIAQSLARVRPDAIVNAAAYTNVERAEADREAAFRANSVGPRLLAEATSAAGVPLIHISTDFVFDGNAARPYRPGDPTAPLNVYGESKLAGEMAVLDADPCALVIRTSWLYWMGGRNFVTAVLGRLREKGRVEVVTDQRGSPTSALSLAELLVGAAQQKIGGDIAGIRHFADDGAVSRYGFACAIREEAIAAGFVGPSSSVDPVPGPTNAPVRRPAYSALDPSAISSEVPITSVQWRDALRHAMRSAFREGVYL
jgi:dTDP-4-dehydrorhamnose reductase